MKRSIGFVAICVLLLGVSIQAQAPQGPPKPGPEVQKLAYFVGTWKEVGKSTMEGMSGPISSTQKWEWMPGGFFLKENMNMTMPMGKSTALGVMGYDPNSKMYTYNQFGSDGGTVSAKGTVTGDTWNWTADMMMGPAPVKTKVTVTQVSKTKYTFKLETSPDGNTWTTGIESTLTKVTAAPAAAPAKKP